MYLAPAPRMLLAVLGVPSVRSAVAMTGTPPVVVRPRCGGSKRPPGSLCLGQPTPDGKGVQQLASSPCGSEGDFSHHCESSHFAGEVPRRTGVARGAGGQQSFTGPKCWKHRGGAGGVAGTAGGSPPCRKESASRRSAGVSPPAFLPWVLMPRTTDGTSYFGIAAQALPVLLLALAIEARLFGVRIRRNEQDENHDPRHYTAGTFELCRQPLSVLTVLLLFAAEMHALREGRGGAAPGRHEGRGSRTPGSRGASRPLRFLAYFGVGTPRLIATLESKNNQSEAPQRLSSRLAPRTNMATRTSRPFGTCSSPRACRYTHPTPTATRAASARRRSTSSTPRRTSQ